MERIYRYSLLAFMGLLMVDPTNLIFHKKEIMFVAFMGIAILANKIKFYNVQIRYTILLFIMALLSVAMGVLLYGANLIGTSSYFKSLIVIFVAFALSKLTVDDLLRKIYYVGVALSAYIILLYFCFLTHIINLDFLIDASTNADNTIMIALRKFLGIDMVMFFYKSMPFCFFALAYSLRKNLILPAVIISVSIVVGGSRTPILMGMAILFYILSSKSKTVFKFLIPLVLTITMLVVVTELLSAENRDGGDELKFTAVSELLSQSSILGHGVGATYYSSDRGLVSNSEMTYFEMLYQYGWLMTPIVIFLLFSPVAYIYKHSRDFFARDFAIAYFAYLINAGTNPLLFNSTGMFVFACAITIMAKVKEINRAQGRMKFVKD